MAQKVLLYEVDSGIRDATSELLTLEGFEVCHADTHRKIIKKLRFEKPDIILMDLIIPCKSLFKAMQLIKKHKQPFIVPVVLFSVNNKIESIAKEVDAEGYISKPYDANSLVEIIKNLLKKIEVDPVNTVVS